MAFKFTEEQLNTLDKSFIVELFLRLQEQNDKLSAEIQDLNKKIEFLIEQVTLLNPLVHDQLVQVAGKIVISHLI